LLAPNYSVKLEEST